ncbi:MAG: thioredoxin-disulfide reductase [Desulfovibrio sp.]|jgi:thioredoxin reductase (NADPH)|nr:thioredoxin-disulfide reductase [Desulfovibrio sp.]
MTSLDALVVGAGPAGITAAMYLARSGCSVALCERLTSGGQMLMTAALENYPGFPEGIKGYELADRMAAHLDGLAVERLTGDVQALAGKAPDFTATVDGRPVPCRTLLVCTGAKHRPLGVPDEERLVGRGVSYCAVCDGNFFRGRRVAVVGGGNSAMEEALYLSKIAAEVTLIHRRDEFRGAKLYLQRLESMPGKVVILRSSVVTALHGESDLTGITVRNVATGEERQIPMDGLFVYVGSAPETAYLPPELERDDRGFIVTDTEMRTSVPGIFAAGDIRSKNCRQVITAAGDGATAAHAAFLFLERV